MPIPDPMDDHGHCQPSAGTEVSSIYRDRTQAHHRLSYNLLYWFKPRARRGRAASATRPASCLRPGWPRPAARYVLRAAVRESSAGQGHASGGGAQAPRWRGRRSRVPAEWWRAWGAPIPSAIDPGRAEQTRPMASRSFVQWRAPPGRHEPRPLHGVWVDGRRDGSQVSGGRSLLKRCRREPDPLRSTAREASIDAGCNEIREVYGGPRNSVASYRNAAWNHQEGQGCRTSRRRHRNSHRETPYHLQAHN